MRSLASSEIHITLRTTYTFVEFYDFLEHIKVILVILYVVLIQIIQFLAVSCTGDSEDIIYVIFLLSRQFGILVVRISSLVSQETACQLIVTDQLLSLIVRICFIERIRNIYQSFEDSHLTLNTHTFCRLTQTLACLFVFAFSVEIDVCQTLLA